MKTCIICREEKENFNDEHVIPDSIQGYYHIYKICVDCNSKLGSAIDNKLTNHKFIEFQRHLLGIKGKSGRVPNPFSGTHVLKDNPDQKVRLEVGEDGKFIPRLLPNVPTSITNQFTITIDKKDEGKKETIIQKFLYRNGIPRENVQIDEKQKSDEKPWIQTSIKIDIHNFKLAILKIAYEFTIDQVPAYFDEPQAMEISEILKNADFEKLDNKVNFMGDGLNKKVLEPFSHLIDLENDNHYLILFDSPDIGLLCFVNLFNVFSLGIKMSETSSFLSENLLVGKNDMTKKEFRVYNISEILSQTYTPIEYRFQYFLPQDQHILNEFMQNDKSPEFSFYRQNDHIPFFDSDSNIKYENIDTKLQEEQLQKIVMGDTKNEIITQIILDEELFIKLLPANKLYKVVSVQIEQYRRSKI